jgi:hypothetical protein
MREQAIQTAIAVSRKRYPTATAVFAAGSLVRGEGTPYSDLDLVVILPSVPNAYRESFLFDNRPVEAFVHDSETLQYFFLELDRPSGAPALPQMVAEGAVVVDTTGSSRELKELARSLLAAGPPALTSAEHSQIRYHISDLLDDLRTPRAPVELLAIGARLFEILADYQLRARQHWSGKGKSLAYALSREEGDLSNRYADAFGRLFISGESEMVVALVRRVLEPYGGPLFDGQLRHDCRGNRRRALNLFDH